MKDYYCKNINLYINSIKDYNPQQYLFDFLGFESENLNIILMFGVTTSNYGIALNNKFYCAIRPYYKSRFNKEIDFVYDLPYSTSLILHEFAHSFINPLTSKYSKTIDQVPKEKFEEMFEKQSYEEHVQTAIKETLIRTIECLYISISLSIWHLQKGLY